MNRKEKLCNECEQVLETTMFGFSNKKKGYLRSKCRKCLLKINREYNRRSRAKRKSKSLYHVYYLPEEHYVGITNDLVSRMGQHRYSKRITEGYDVIASFERRVDASWFEIMFHVRGYNGYRGDKN